MCAAIQVGCYFNGVVEAMLDLACGKPPMGHSRPFWLTPSKCHAIQQMLFFDLHELPYERQAK
jgi:hypothetical protein